MVEQIVRDIRCICSGMKPAREEMQLIRNLNQRCVLKGIEVGDEVKLLGLTSTSTTGQLIDYGKDDYRKPAQILRICVSAGMSVLALGNDENEVILPPAAYRVIDRYDENGTDIVVLDALQPLDLDGLISEAKSVYGI